MKFAVERVAVSSVHLDSDKLAWFVDVRTEYPHADARLYFYSEAKAREVARVLEEAEVDDE